MRTGLSCNAARCKTLHVGRREANRGWLLDWWATRSLVRARPTSLRWLHEQRASGLVPSPDTSRRCGRMYFNARGLVLTAVDARVPQSLHPGRSTPLVSDRQPYTSGTSSPTTLLAKSPITTSGLAGRDDANTTARDDGGLSLRSFGCCDWRFRKRLRLRRPRRREKGCAAAPIDRSLAGYWLPPSRPVVSRSGDDDRPPIVPIEPVSTTIATPTRNDAFARADTPIHTPSFAHDTARSLHAPASSGVAHFANTLFPLRVELTPLALA